MKLQIWDTAGQERFRFMKMAISQPNVFLFMEFSLVVVLSTSSVRDLIT